MKSLSELVLEDSDYETGVLTKVAVSDKYVDLNWGSTGFCYERSQAPDFVPTAGMETVVWGSIGRPVRGIAIDGNVIYYRSPAEQNERHRLRVAQKEREDAEQYEKDKASNDARIAAMPAPFQERIRAFREHDPEWGAKFEGYELFVCEQAIAFAARLKTPAAIKGFHAASPERQREEVPELSDDHSGNTFGSACSLASLYLSNPELVPNMHGALCPLVGCEDYGCYASRENLTTSKQEIVGQLDPEAPISGDAS